MLTDKFISPNQWRVLLSRSSSLKEPKPTNSTIYIPESLWSFLKFRISEFKTKNEYFKFLLDNYLSELLESYKNRKITRKDYQPKGIPFRKFIFKPENKEWKRLADASNETSISRSYLFVLMVSMDVKNF